MTAYTDAVERRNDLRSQRDDLLKQHRIALATLDGRIAAQQHVIDVAEAGGPAEAYVVAREVLGVQWVRSRTPLDRDMARTGPRPLSAAVQRQIAAAIEDLQAGCPAMRREYFGVKQYAGFGDQESNHPYGYGPKHGSIWFSIGLKNLKVGLMDEQTIACIQWLRALRENPELLP